MPAVHQPSREKVRAHRDRLRAQGLRPIQIWVPDVRSPSFTAEARRQSLLVASSPQEADDQAFADAAWGDLGDDGGLEKMVAPSAIGG